ncbi:hypothetical protein ABXJ76_17125 [Methylobacter sp. G7]|uniref:hypothetical protein n=1 Tax=Methylobacter sp. G7 TaxID=3230117 RepID=UPI003D8011A2
MQIKYEFREATPQRTFVGNPYNDYRRYKDFLRSDFNNRCGYTDCPDIWFGGKRCFHIDHFKPKSKHPSLVTSYSNLVYSCSYVNIQKSDDEGMYLDPCDTDFNQHFFRDDEGNIQPISASAEARYMHKKLKLGLSRYGLIWMLDQLRMKKMEIRALLNGAIHSQHPTRAELLEAYLLLDSEFDNYFEYLGTDL